MPLPATSVVVSLYLVELLESSNTSSPETSALSAINWAHEKACLPVLVDSVVEQVAAAARRELARMPKRKEPLKKEQVMLIVDKLLAEGGALHLMTAIKVTVGFAGFMRWDEYEANHSW